MEDLTDEQISVLLAQAEKRLGLSSPESRYSPIPQPIGKGRDAEVPRQPEAKFSVRDPRQQLGKSQLKVSSRLTHLNDPISLPFLLHQVMITRPVGHT